MPITTARKTKIVRSSDYIFQQTSPFAQSILFVEGSGRLVAMEVEFSASVTFTILVEDVAQTSSVTFTTTTGTQSTQWLQPALDDFRTSVSECNISFSRQFEIKINVPTSSAITIHYHLEYDVEVTA